MLGRLVLLSGACASAAAENVVGSTKSIEKKNRLGSSSSRRVHFHGLNEEDDVQADGGPLKLYRVTAYETRRCPSKKTCLAI